jgi:hypothetical protein
MTRAFVECSFYRGSLWGRMHLCAPKQRDVTYPRSLGAGIRHRLCPMLGPSRTGARFSTNAPLLPSSMADCHVQTPKPRHSPAAWWNGSTAIRRVRRPDSAACGAPEYVYDPLLPYGIGSTGHAWLHSRCWEAWHAARKREAAAALKAMGVGKPTATEERWAGGGGAEEILRSTPNPYGP